MAPDLGRTPGACCWRPNLFHSPGPPRGSDVPDGKLQPEIVRKSKGQHGFAVVPWRWIVERTFAWLGCHRGLKVDYECLPETTEALIHIAMIRLMVRRLAPQ